MPQTAGSQTVTNAAASGGSSHRGLHLDPKLKVSTLVHDGKLLYEMNRLDAADVKLKEAIKLDPQNQAALYYLNLVWEARFKAPHCHPVEATRAGWKFLNPSILEGGLGVIDLNAIPEFSPAGFLPVCRHARWQDGFCSSHRMDPRRAVSPLR